MNSLNQTDLTTNMTAVTDRLAKISSLALMSTAMANFVPALGSMSDGDILISVTALSILIITVVADACIQIVGMWWFLHHRVLFPEEILSLSLMLLLFLVLGSTAIMVLTTKKYLETKYQEKHNLAASQEFSDLGVSMVDKLRNLVKKYYVMAEISSPQLVIARSSACVAAGVICLANALILVQAIVRTGVEHRSLSMTGSSYGCSTKWILLVQTIGVIFGTISTSFRWFTAVRFRYSSAGADYRSLSREFKVEEYWTTKLVECQGSSISPLIKHQKCRRFLYNARGLAVHLLLRAQICVVLFNKLVLVISCCITGAIINIIQHLKRMMMNSSENSDAIQVEGEFLQNMRLYSLRLEGEPDLPDNMLQSIPKQVDEVLKAARRQKPSSLIEFLRGSSFKGVAQFDSPRVKSIHDKEPKNCWSLAVVTLTSIAATLPNVEKSKVDNLVEDVRDGLFFVKIVEESFYNNEEWNNIKKAADFWLRVDLFRKWQEINLAEISSSSDNAQQALKKLALHSKKIVSVLNTDIADCPMFNPANWKPKIIAANSMYRISSTILYGCDEEDAGEELFEQLRRMIADVLAACLTNLGRVIAKKCHLKAIEERERSVRQAALLFGRSEEMLGFLARRDLPVGLNPDHAAAYVEEWRSAMLLEMEMVSDPTTPSSCGVGTASSEGGGSCSRLRVESYRTN